MAVLSKHNIQSTPFAFVARGAVSEKRTVPKLSEAQNVFHGGLGKTLTFSLARKTKLLKIFKTQKEDSPFNS